MTFSVIPSMSIQTVWNWMWKITSPQRKAQGKRTYISSYLYKYEKDRIRLIKMYRNLFF